MGLRDYRRKRRFDVTPEPRGRTARRQGHRFVIQKHAARRMHYDLRLELDGVMKSWAVTRGPSLVAGEKRLAVEVEDHPVEYNAFEGTIPAGQYGGGTVMIWDQGNWIPEFDPHLGLRKGHLEFTLEGEKLHGRWHLVRMHKRSGETKEPWLLIKADDAAARSDVDILEAQPLSVVSGRSIAEIAAGEGGKRVWHSSKSAAENVAAGATRKSRAARKAASGDASLPDFIAPALAVGRDQPPSGKVWVHEIKYDGYRIQARLDKAASGGEVRLLTRKGLDWAKRFPNVAAAVASLPVRTALIDGEIVVQDASGATSFPRLQAALEAGARDGFLYEAFDLLHLDGRDLAGLLLVERKAELARLIASARDGAAIRYSGHIEDDGATVLRHICGMRLEGIVSKRKDAPYRSGRTDAFVKVKCGNAQELVVGGFVPSKALPKAIGALVVGHYDDGALVYAGRVGTGYSRDTARALWSRLQPLAVKRPPFDRIPPIEARRREVHWVAPQLVIEANFGGWSTDGMVRQAAFKGLREDKSPREVVRERAAAASAAKPQPMRSVAAAAGAAASRGPGGEDGAGGAARFTHPDRVYWPDAGVRKRDLADYYRAVWDLMAPHVAGRPLSLLRCPDGITGQCFFQKHVSAGLDAAGLRTVTDVKGRQVIAVDDLDGLLSLVQAGVLEVHVRGSTIDRLDLCNRIVLDIDPGEDVAWSDVIAAARDVRVRLAGIGLDCFVKLTGGKGLHVVLPIDAVDWAAAKSFAQAVALAMAADEPGRYVARMTKSARQGRIFIDYLRNAHEQTAVAAYSTRARPGAPVSWPVSWEELGRTTAGNQYSVRDIGRRLAGRLRDPRRDPWAALGSVTQRLPDFRRLSKA